MGSGERCRAGSRASCFDCDADMSSQVVDIVDVSAPKGRASSMMFSGWLRLYNHSIYGLQVTFSDGEAFYIPPQNRRTICLNQPATYFDWVQVLSFDVGAG